MGSLEEDMLKMLTNSEFSDMVFLCGEEEEEVSASRLLVAARSPILHSMLLTSGMAETNLSRVPLPGVDPSTMRICMEFFYTGKVRDSSWNGFFSIMQVVSAGRFFLHPKLEELAISGSALLKYGVDEDSLVDIGKAYTCGVELQDDLHPDMNVLMQRLSKWIVHRAHWFLKWSLKCYRHLSEQAFIHLVENMDRGLFKLEEYCILHLVVFWCAAQLLLTPVDPSVTCKTVWKTVKKALPWALDDVKSHVTMTPDEIEYFVTPTMLKVRKLLAEPVRSCLKKVKVDFSKIPAQVLSKVIEPLEIIPNSMLFSAYKQQALQIPMG